MARGSNRNKGRGGARQPANPAAVSAPGSGARTDGGPGSKRQPLRLAPGQPYGARQAMEAQQSAAPLAVASPGPSGPGAPGAAGAPSAPGPLDGGVFGPTQRPNEPATAGLIPASQEPLDAQTVLRILYGKRPSPWIARLVGRG